MADLKEKFTALLTAAQPDGYGKSPFEVNPPASLDGVPDATPGVGALGAQAGVVLEGLPPTSWEVSVDSKDGVPDLITHGSVLIAAITSCTNTSNPSVMLAAGLLAQKANARGLTVKPSVKTSLGPGSRVVTDYLTKTGLQKELDRLGFQTVGYGCTTCIGNSGPLDKGIEDVVKERGRHRRQRALRKPQLRGPRPPVDQGELPHVAAARRRLRPRRHRRHRPRPPNRSGTTRDGKPVYLKDIWPTSGEIATAMASALSPDVFRKLYTDFAEQNPKWNEIKGSAGLVYDWDRDSTYIQEPPFFDAFSPTPARHRRNPRRAPAGHLWRQRDHRPHFAGRRDQEGQPGRALPRRARRRSRRLQQLRLAPRQ